MKTKQIKKVLATITSNFIDSIQSEEIRNIIKKHGYVTGGCIPSMLMNEYVNDYDIYLDSKDAVDKVLNYFNGKPEKALEYEFIDQPKQSKYTVNLITNNSINFSDKIQIVVGFYGKPDDVINCFDFAHIKSYFVLDIGELVVKEDVYKLIFEKELIYTGSSYPLSSFLRIKKYIKKGWNVSNPEMIKIALDVVVALSPGIKKIDEISIDELNDDEIKDISTSLNYRSIFDNEDENDEVLMNNKLFTKHLNGVDPLTIQAELIENHNEYLTISEIIKMMK